MATVRRTLGRPEVTSHAEIEDAAFRLFSRYGFEQTTVDAIAEEVGVSRTTLFRYFPSKNDMAWGQNEVFLENFRELLQSQPEDIPMWEAVRRGVSAFHDYPAESAQLIVDRLRLLMNTPALQAHSVLKFAEWRRVVAEFVADRLGLEADDPLPVIMGHVSLALAHAAYETWLPSPEDSPLSEVVYEHMGFMEDVVVATPLGPATAPRAAKRRLG